LRVKSSLVSGQILFVEDDDSVAASVSRLLRSAGYECTRAASVEQAIEYLTRDIPRIIISDLNLPDMDGESFLRRVRADARTRDVPFIMYTGSCEHDSADLFREAGATAYCSKYKPEELLRLIAEIA
jgi:CheY-like chemotaxis protein